jgi:hypothetical protein
MCTAQKFFIKFTFQKGGENSFECFKSSVKPLANTTHVYVNTGRRAIQETG